MRPEGELEFRVLGPLEVVAEGRPLNLGGIKQRALLAILLLEANRVVSVERLIELLWAEEPPETAPNVLQVYISQLRKVLEPDGGPYRVLVSRTRGYVLQVGPDQLDVTRFEKLLATAAGNRPEEAGAILRQALDLWRGAALAEFVTDTFALSEGARLSELRLRALEDRIQADLDVGLHRELVGELEAIVGEHPLRERFCGQLMLALYRSGRQAEASEVYQRTRRRLADELGMEPGKDLQRLLTRILQQQTDLDVSGVRSDDDSGTQPIQPARVASVTDTASTQSNAKMVREEPRQPPGRSRRERKVVSVLFCDLVGFTSTSERADPEEVQARIVPYHQRLRREIEGFGGTVEKFIGDAVMAIFGAPIAHEDDAERAVRAGLAILDAVTELNAAGPDYALSVRLGVNTGEVIVSLDSVPERGEAMVFGDVVNTAARIQAAAAVGSLVVGEATYRLTSARIKYEALEPIHAKGKAGLVSAWRAVAPIARLGSDVVRAPATPLVGRGLEFLQLRTAFDRVARERSVQLVTVVGEPGVGKSRLVTELFGYIEGLDDLVTWRQGRCLPYGEGIAFWALGEILKAHAGIYESDSVVEATSKLEATLPDTAERPWLRARLLPLLGIESSPAGQDEAFIAWRRFLEWVAEKSPAVMVVEDIHWADDALLRFLGHLAEWALDVPLLLVCTARPELYEKQPAWGTGLTNQTAIRLSPLSDLETAHLVAQLLDQAVLPSETQQLLLAQAGGNPLYAEEFVRMLRDLGRLTKRGAIAGDLKVPVPDSLQALIAARLDTLPVERKLMLQDAAVLGKVFWADAVAAMGSYEKKHVAEALHQLSRQDLIREGRESSIKGETEQSFKHIIVRDVAYAQIPRAERAAKHIKAVSWLETKAGERIEDLADVLAYHTGEALSLAQASGDGALASKLALAASRYALMAGERALSLDATKALSLLQRARELTPEGDPRFTLVLRRYAEAARNSGRLPEAAVALEEAIAASTAKGDFRTAAEALSMLSFIHHHLGKSGLVEMAERAVAMLEADPGLELVEALGNLAAAHGSMGAYRAAVMTAERAMQIAGRLNPQVPAHLLGTHGFYRCHLGELDGLAEMELALELSLAAGEGRDAAILHNNLGVVRGAHLGPASAASQFERGEEFAEARGLAELGKMIGVNRVGGLVELGQLEDALVQADALTTVLGEGGSQVFLGILRGHQVCALAELGREVGIVGDELRQLARDSDDPPLLVMAATAAATSMLAAGNKDASKGLIAEIASADYHDDPECAFVIPALARAAGPHDDPGLVARLAPSIDCKIRIQVNARATVLALAAEVGGEYRRAAALHIEAAILWETFGNRLEEAHALLGAGRCLVAADAPDAEAPLLRARALFAKMGARPRIAECDSLIDRAARLSS